MLEYNANSDLIGPTIEITACTDFNAINLMHFKRFIINTADNNKVALSKREMICLSYFLLGHTITDISKKLEIAPTTVRCYVDRVKAKFNCNTKTELFSFMSTTNLYQLAGYFITS